MKVSFLITLISLFGLSMTNSNFSFKTKVGDTVPHFKMENLAGEELAIEDFRGKVVLLAFFGTKCPPCLKELPQVQAKLRSQISKDSFEVLAIAPLDNKSNLTKFNAKHQFDFTYIPDVGKKIFSLFAQSSLPRTVVLDPKGKIVYQSQGYYKTAFNNMVDLISTEISKL